MFVKSLGIKAKKLKFNDTFALIAYFQMDCGNVKRHNYKIWDTVQMLMDLTVNGVQYMLLGQRENDSDHMHDTAIAACKNCANWSRIYRLV